MRTASRFVATAVVATGLCVSGASAALAQQDCAYVPTACEEPTEVLPTQQNRTETQTETEVDASTTPDSLPFTGGEIALGVLAGAGAVGAGAALVVAARRRPSLTD